MTATNHAVTGALIGLIIGQPELALPLAFLSHFVCDAIPHYGNEKSKTWSKSFKRMLTIDGALCIALVAILAVNQPIHWLLAVICAFVATSPDFYWLPKYLYGLRHHQAPHENSLDRLLGSDGIQWFQKPIGAVVEAAWLVAGASLLAIYVK